MLVLSGEQGHNFIGGGGAFKVTIVLLKGNKVRIGFEGTNADGTKIPFDREDVHLAKLAGKKPPKECTEETEA